MTFSYDNNAQQSVVRAKLHAPRIALDIVRRERLLDQLTLISDRQFTLISAPAGYGKSTLVAHWLITAGVPFAWFSIEESDNDVRQFLTYLIAAVRTHSENACAATLEALGAQELPPPAKLRALLANDLDDIHEPFTLVLDDFYRIARPQIHEIVDSLLDFPPQFLHLVIVTRHDPPLQLNRLRAGGRMGEVRERDLRFTKEETRAVLHRLTGYAITGDVLEHVHSQLEGWIVGLRLLCLALQNRDDPEHFLRGLSGGTLAMQDYLAGEVLSQQSDTIRKGILSLAILERFSASLYDALCEKGQGEDGGAYFLSELNRANLFIIDLDNKGEWFRFHHLFQRLLLNQLETQTSPGDIRAMHLRASAWFETQGMVEESLRHAMAADDPSRAAGLLDRFREQALKTDRSYVLEKWLTLLPEEALNEHPELLMVRAWMYVHLFNYPLVIQVLDRIEELLSGTGKLEDLSGEIANLRGMALHRLGDSKNGLRHLKAALSLVPGSSRETRAMTELSFCVASQQDGKKEQAIEFLDGMMNGSPASQGVRRARINQTYTLLHIVSGHLAQAERSNQPIVALPNETNTYGEAYREYLQGLIHLYRYELDAALGTLDYFRRADSPRYMQFRRTAIDALVSLVLSCELLGRSREAESALNLIREFVSGVDAPRLMILLESAQARVDVLRGDSESAIRWAETADVAFDPTMLWILDLPEITACRVRIAEGSANSLERAKRALHRMVKMNEDHHNDIKLTEILCLLAMTCRLQGDHAAARLHLDRALELARAGGVILPFVEWNPSLAKEMLELLPHNSDWNCKRIRQILEGQQAEKPIEQPLIDPLTDRELEVLKLLANRLYDKEIANELGISIETVKTHNKRIRGKLGVSSRREAAMKARELGLLRDHDISG